MPPRPKPKQKGLYLHNGIRIINGLCENLLPTLGQYDLVFADPPFNIGQKYQDYHDRKNRESYQQWLLSVVRSAWLATSGVLCLHGPDALCELYLQAMQGRPRKAWINWHYRFGQCGRSNWIDARCHCLIYAKRKDHTWNPDDVLVESDRAAVYGDRRIHDHERGGKRLPGTVWGIPSDGEYWGRVQGNSAERVKSMPNQLPEVYMERLVRAYTNPGDRVLDLFSGSGTLPVVCQALGRKCDALEMSRSSCEAIIKRLEKGAIRVKPL